METNYLWERRVGGLCLQLDVRVRGLGLYADFPASSLVASAMTSSTSRILAWLPSALTMAILPFRVIQMNSGCSTGTNEPSVQL